MFYVWLRNKHVARENVDGQLRISTSVEESFFAASVTITVRVSDLEITSLQASMPKPINEECLGALNLLQRAVGMRIVEGLTKRIDDQIGRSAGCTHMANLVLESCHTAAVSFRQVKMAEALAAGLSPDDFYREWIKTRPKELRNSCVAFADGSPLLQRVTSQDAREVSRSIDMGARLTAASTLPIVPFSRNKLVGVGRLDKDTFMARALLEDNAHSMAVEVEIRRADFEIVAVRGWMARVPNEMCPHAVAALQGAVGLAVRPGLTAAVDQKIMRHGCPHLGNLLLEACHSVIQGTLGAEIEDLRAAGEDPNWDQVRGKWLGSMPMLHNSCLAYSAESPLMRRLAVG
ncbi:MAG: DUF2889 domain-containing protein [Chloroflexi bacterium]|nr:DUF2889 domain-containing protein [Chloroflexota bacterium]